MTATAGNYFIFGCPIWLSIITSSRDMCHIKSFKYEIIAHFFCSATTSGSDKSKWSRLFLVDRKIWARPNIPSFAFGVSESKFGKEDQLKFHI